MTQLTIDPEQLDQLILQRLPILMQQNVQIQGLVLDLARQQFAERQETDDRFYQLLGELRRDREEQARKWEQYTAEQNHKWEEQNRKWDQYIAEQNCKWEEQNRKWEEHKSEFNQLLGELRRDREEQARKWEQYTAEQNHKWEEQNRKWDQYIAEQNCKWEEQNRKWEEHKSEFNQLLGELKRDREEQNRKWEEQNRKWDEQNDKWNEQNDKWDEQNRKWDEAKQEFNRMHEAIMAIAKKHDRSISALGARWGLKSERSFRNALVGILETNFEVQVLNIIDYDDEGIVFGRPDQIELDVIIKNGLLLICELKSSMSRSDMYIFERKVRFYEKRHQRQVTRMLVISPMIDDKAEQVAQQLGIEVYSDSIDVTEW